MVTHSSILAWRIPWVEEPGRLQPMGPRRVGYDWMTNTQHTTHTASHTHMCVCFSLPSGKTMKQEILILGNCPLKTCRSFLCHLFQEAFCNWPSYKWEFTPLNTIVLASYLHRWLSYSDFIHIFSLGGKHLENSGWLRGLLVDTHHTGCRGDSHATCT